jgi:hypothetical protein
MHVRRKLLPHGARRLTIASNVILMRLLAFVSLAFCVACSGVKGVQVTSEGLDQTAVQVHQSNLSDQDKTAFDEVKARADNGEYDVTGKTVGTLISDQEAYDADQKAQREKAATLAAQVKQRHDDSLRALQHVITVALVDKSYHVADVMNGDYQDLITFELAFRNNGSKAIRAVKGTLGFKNLLGDIIYSANFEHSIDVAPGQSISWDGTLDFNQYNDALVQLRDAQLRNIRLDWEPEQILFSDGTKMEIVK